MSFLVVSNIVLWIAVISLAVVNYALLRQVGVLYERVAPAGALMVNRTLEVRAQAPALEALTLSDERISIGGVSSKSQLLFCESVPDKLAARHVRTRAPARAHPHGTARSAARRSSRLASPDAHERPRHISP